MRTPSRAASSPAQSHLAALNVVVCQLAAYEPLLGPQITYVSPFHDLTTAEITAEHIPQPTAAMVKAS